jgi:DNA-binding SARP family transcriptional activator
MVLAASAPVRLVLLGGFELLAGDTQLHVPLSAQRLLAFLALHDRPLSRLFVAGSLWPDTAESRSCANLRSTLWRLHKPGCQLVASAGQHLRLDASVAVDLHETMRLAQRALAATAELDAADLAKLYQAHDLLLDWYFDWVLIERERFRQLRLHALETLCQRLTVSGKFALAVQAGLAAVADEPLRESAQRALIGAYLGEGNRVDALHQYHAYRTTLRAELQLQPSHRMEALMQFQD